MQIIKVRFLCIDNNAQKEYNSSEMYVLFTKHALVVHENGANFMLKRKNGFTLVELMIVVVIMGILVAVAIPVYNAVTKNAKTKTCHSNCEVLEKAASQYYVNSNSEDVAGIANDSAAFSGGSALKVSSQAEAETKFSSEYMSNLDNPLAIFDGGCVYDIYYGDGGKSVAVYCESHGNRLGETI